MARFKYFRYSFDKKNEGKLPGRNFVRIEDETTAVYDRPLTPKEIAKAKLTEAEDSHVNVVTRYRMAKGLTQFELAKVADVPRNAIQRYESFTTSSCPLSHAVKLAKALDISVMDLIEDYEK